ncbi:MAG: hypothetical protein J1G38_04175 [Clostridiales bacterium]|nr:hypothetical protein [Clostridiales bacterium]
METYRQFLDRINAFQKKELRFCGKFACNPSLALKVNDDNTFKAFYGDTVVFALDKATKRRLTEYVDLLYRAAPQCFCERLVEDTFHMTLHDLNSAPSLRDVESLFVGQKIKEKAEDMRECGDAVIKMKSTYVFNMVNTSLVLGLRPIGEGDYIKLMKLYSAFDEVKKLNYPFTPHITLAYYGVGGFDEQAARKLEEAVNRINDRIDLTIELRAGDLYYQTFESMNDYRDELKLF